MNISVNPTKIKNGLNVAIIGAGVVGVATAYALANQGFNVTLIDCENGPGMGASYANGAQLSYAYTDALASPSIIKKIPGILLGLDNSISIKHSLSMDYIKWLIAFLGNTPKNQFRKNTIEGIKLALESKLEMALLNEKYDLKFAKRAAGKLHIYENQTDLDSARNTVNLKQSNGISQSILSENEAKIIEPALEARSHPFAGAIYSPEDDVADPYLFCTQITKLLVEQFGVQAIFNTRVLKIDDAQSQVKLQTDKYGQMEFDTAVICAGIDARKILNNSSEKSKLMPIKGYSFTAPLGKYAPKVSITDVSRKIVFAQLDSQIRVAGVAAIGNGEKSVDQKILDSLIANSKNIFPEALNYEKIQSSWSGIRPMSANSLPIIKNISRRLIVNIGHGMLGWTYAMGSGKRAAKVVANSLSRF